MKILIVSQYFYPENFRINDVALGLKERGHEVTILTGKPNYPSGNYFEGYSWSLKKSEIWNDIKIYRTNLLLRGNGKAINLFLNYFSFAIFAIFKIFSIRSKFDKIFVFAPSPITVGIPGIVASKIFNAKSILWVHDLWPESIRIAGGIENKLVLNIIDMMTRWIYKNVDKILIQSEGFRSYINIQVEEKEKITYYPFYAEPFYKLESPNPKYLNELPKGFKLLFAGNIGEGQSFPTLLAAAKILKEMNMPIHWVIFGEGRMKESVQREISELGLNDFFILKGSLPATEMPKYFSCVDGLIVSLKKSDIFSITIPGKLQSYLACGRPIIGSLDGIGSEIINQSQSGITAKAESVEDLVNAVIKLYNSTIEERIQMGLNARSYFEKEFEREFLLDKLEGILHN
ncbi:glycosyltransferase family 4 protein [Aquirufa antheringensis]|uniref:glycosyltransferase family 4 protein n=1 Tax=Aquirufa antheringensis TaxID=2516559 RepID=UPI0022A87B8E|nr:glycosyltransferase family 4 protein [Aquirufa antheringensis]MCZ2486942.1 glycosyltransferase family 4 protein [Aquirufa antheringensis]